MLVARRTQLEQSQGVLHFHLWSSVAPGLAALARPELRTYAGKLLRRLSRAYAIRLEGFAFTAEQIHLVVQWTPEAAEAWSPEELERRWRTAHPKGGLRAPGRVGATSAVTGDPSGGMGWPSGASPMDPTGGLPGMDPTGGMGNPLATLEPLPFTARARLASLSAFLQQFKQLLTFQANERLQRKGTIWQGRFKLAPLPDESAVAGAMAFVDLLPVAKGEGDTPEQAAFTGLHARTVLFKTKFGQPPLGPLGEPDGAWQPLPAEVTQELRDAAMAQAHEAMEPPIEGGLAWVVGLQGDAHASHNGVGFGFTLRRYLGLLDQLVQKAKAWPHVSPSAPGRAKPAPTPAWEEAVEQAISTLGLLPQAFTAQWVRLAKLRR